MSWLEYYQQPVVSFGRQGSHYREAIERMRDRNPEILDKDKSYTFVLGGFTPGDSPGEFLELCKRIHSNPQNRYIFLDMNSYPLQSIDRVVYPDRVQATLCSTPLCSGSVDFVFCDFTLNFMEGYQLERFGSELSRMLTPNGVLIAALNLSGFDSSGTLPADRGAEILCYKHTPQTLARFFRGLKLVHSTKYEVLTLPSLVRNTQSWNCIVAFVKRESILLEFLAKSPELAENV